MYVICFLQTKHHLIRVYILLRIIKANVVKRNYLKLANNAKENTASTSAVILSIDGFSKHYLKYLPNYLQEYNCVSL